MAKAGHNLSRLPPPPKVEAEKPDHRAYRSRPILPGPFGDEEPPFEGTLAEVVARHAVDTEAGMEPVLEYRVHGCPWMPYREPLTVEEVAQLGHARRGERGWIIDPEGQRMIYEAMGVPGGTR